MSPRRLAATLLAAALGVLLAGLAAGSEGWSLAWTEERALLLDIRAPRTLGALLAGACLGLAGAVAQGLFRNPLADPYLLGSAAGASLAVTLALAVGGTALSVATASPLGQVGLAAAAFAGALAGVLLAVLLAGGTARPWVLLLSGVVVGVLAGALSEAVALLAPETLRGRQAFLLGTTSFVGWSGALLLAAALAACMRVAVRTARVLDALVLGDDVATSLGLPLPWLRACLVAAMALATGTAVAQTGLVAFVGLAAPHLVRRFVTSTHGPLLVLSALAGAVLLGCADLAARSLLAPRELPVGLLTAVLGGGYLMLLLRRRTAANSAVRPAWAGAASIADRSPARPGGPSAGLALDTDALVVDLDGRRVLDLPALRFAPGQWTAIVGPNGAGKSTLLSVIAGLRDAAGSGVRLDGRALPRWPLRERARAIAWASQHGEIETALAARDVVMLGRLPHHGLFGTPDPVDHAAVDAALHEADCEALGARRLDALSGGERRRVLLARVWAAGAPITLLDEPTTHLDAPHQRALLRGLRRRAKAGATVVTVLHDLTLALAADRILVLDGGRLVADGEPGETALHRALESASGGAVHVRRLDGPDGTRWIAYPAG